jgi:hypothetical protein
MCHSIARPSVERATTRRETFVRHALGIVISAALAVLTLALPAAAQTATFKANVQGLFGIRNSTTCAPNLDCGRARIDGFGAATRTLAITGFTPGVPVGCDAVTAVEHMVLDSDGSTLDLALDAALCYPGSSRDAPDSPRAQGDPFKATGTFVIVGGTGAFAGATGSGTLTSVGAGDAIVIHYSGTLAIP